MTDDPREEGRDDTAEPARGRRGGGAMRDKGWLSPPTDWERRWVSRRRVMEEEGDDDLLLLESEYAKG